MRCAFAAVFPLVELQFHESKVRLEETFVSVWGLGGAALSYVSLWGMISGFFTDTKSGI